MGLKKNKIQETQDNGVLPCVMPCCSTCSNFKKPDYRPKTTKVGYCQRLKDEHKNFWVKGHKSKFEIFIQFAELEDFEIEVSEDFGCILHNKA
jgi:hypothetical protein